MAASFLQEPPSPNPPSAAAFDSPPAVLRHPLWPLPLRKPPHTHISRLRTPRPHLSSVPHGLQVALTPTPRQPVSPRGQSLASPFLTQHPSLRPRVHLPPGVPVGASGAPGTGVCSPRCWAGASAGQSMCDAIKTNLPEGPGDPPVPQGPRRVYVSNLPFGGASPPGCHLMPTAAPGGTRDYYSHFFSHRLSGIRQGWG